MFRQAPAPDYTTVTRFFSSKAKAEAYQERLYGRYDIVNLCRTPLFQEDGRYSWYVAKPKE